VHEEGVNDEPISFAVLKLHTIQITAETAQFNVLRFNNIFASKEIDFQM
jgi:hypothetical protein